MSCPAPLGVPSANSLGFIDASAVCCRAPCPRFPLHKVSICAHALDKNYMLIIQQACSRDSECDTSSFVTIGSITAYGPQHFTTNSVQTDMTLRLLVCAAPDAVCVPCTTGGVVSIDQVNVDGTDYVPYLDFVAEQEGGVYGCDEVNCMGGAGPCCDTVALSAMPVGSQVKLVIGRAQAPVPVV